MSQDAPGDGAPPQGTNLTVGGYLTWGCWEDAEAAPSPRVPQPMAVDEARWRCGLPLISGAASARGPGRELKPTYLQVNR